MKYKSAHDLAFGLAFFAPVTALLVLSGQQAISLHNVSDIIGFFVVLAVTGLLLWVWFGTYYTIANGLLSYTCGPIHGAIDVQNISAVEKNKSVWSGVRLGLSRKGLIIKHNKYDEIYISPRSADTFIEHLVKVNPKIMVTEYQTATPADH